MAKMTGDRNKRANGARKPASGASATRPPGKLDFAKARKGLKKIVRENQEWLKEMANR